MKLKSILSYIKFPVLGHMIYIFICLVIGWISEYNKSFIFLEKNIVLKTKVPKNNIMSYKTPSNKGRERGFLSFEGAIAPASIFLKYYLDFSVS